MDKLHNFTLSDLYKKLSLTDEEFEKKFDYRHFTVNHSTNFVDPDTGACTNTIESYNQKFKARHKQEYGTARAMLTDYMHQFVWKKRYGGRESFFNLITHIKEQYPVNVEPQ